MFEVDSLLHRRQRSLKFLYQINRVTNLEKAHLYFSIIRPTIVDLDEGIVRCPFPRKGEDFSSMEAEICVDDVFPYAIAHRRAAEPV